MAHGGSSLPTPYRTQISMPVMPFPSTATGAAQSSSQHLLQPHQHSLNRQSTETLTSVASSSQNSSASPSRPLRRPAAIRSTTYPSKHHSHHSANARPGPQHLFSQSRFSRNYSPSPPPMRDLPPLRTTDEALYGHLAGVDADQFEESSPDAEMSIASLDLSLGSLNGFPYCMGVSETMEQRSRAVAEAEEREYQRARSWKPKERLSGRVEAALKGLTLHHALSRTRLRP